MYDLNSRDDAPPGIAPAAPPVDPAAEFRARLTTITPDLFITWILIAMNVVIFVAMLVGNVNIMQPSIESLIRWGADYGPKTVTGGEWWRIFMSMFLHIGIIHIAFNMFVLWQIGPFMERLLGNYGCAIVYLVSGVAGAFASLAWNPYIVSAGASGAIFGLYGALLGYILIRRDTFPMEVLTPLTKSALLFVGYNLVYGMVRTGTDVAAHIGGLAGGFVCGLVMSVPLTVDPPPARGMRNAIVALGAIPLFLLASTRLPRPIDFLAEIRAFTPIEKQTLAAFNNAIQRGHAEKGGDQQLADRIEKDVIPPWAAEHDKLARIKGLPDRQQRIVAQLVKYMEMRQQAWTLMAQSLRRHDITGVRQANAIQRQAELLARQMSAGTP